MSKFNVGEKVRIVKNRTCNFNDGGQMDKYLDTIMTIKKVYNNHYDMVEDGGRWSWNDGDIQGLAEEEKQPVTKISPNGIEFRYNPSNKDTLPKQVFFNEKKKTTVLKWEDGDITKVKCHDDEFDERTGFLIAYFQKTCGLSRNKANKYLDSLVVEKEDKPIEESLESVMKKTPISMTYFLEKELERIIKYDNEMVFSVYKFIKGEGEENSKYSLECGWPQQCDGLTEKEMEEIGFSTVEEWLVPRSEFKPYVEKNNYIPSREV